VSLESLRKDSELRSETDRQISVAWVLLPIVAALLAFVVVVLEVLAIAKSISNLASSTTTTVAAPAFGGFAAAAGIEFLAGILYLYFFYMLIRRRNQHFSRQQRFFTDLVTVLRGAAYKRNVNADAVLGSIENTVRQSQAEETEKSAVLWVILMLVPLINIIAVLYVLYFLTSDFHKHERREDGMLSDAERALGTMGVQFIFHRDNPIPSRSFVLYFILTIITLGIFGLYWEYVLIKDPNNHFVNHAVYEPQIIQLITPLAA
jgi:ABC-type multidrug transport system fused ATPase/permease subunit